MTSAKITTIFINVTMIMAIAAKTYSLTVDWDQRVGISAVIANVMFLQVSKINESLTYFFIFLVQKENQFWSD